MNPRIILGAFILLMLGMSHSWASACVGGTNGTGQLPSYLTGSEYADGQAPASIQPACMRDFVATVTGGRVVTAAGAITATTADHLIEVNKTVGAATTVNMPSCTSNAGLFLVIVDGKGDAATNNITLTPSAGNINGSTTFVMNINRQAETVWYDGAQCVVFP